jgi:hypothetical protein
MTSPELQEAKMSARRFCHAYNNMIDSRDDTLKNARKWRGEALKEFLGKVLVDQPITMEPPVFFSYGCNVEVGPKCWINSKSVYLLSIAIRIRR